MPPSRAAATIKWDNARTRALQTAQARTKIRVCHFSVFHISASK